MRGARFALAWARGRKRHGDEMFFSKSQAEEGEGDSDDRARQELRLTKGEDGGDTHDDGDEGTLNSGHARDYRR